jgi:putative flippase GtrA
MIARVQLIMTRLLKQDFVRFCAVGVIGFLINLVILKFLHDGMGWPVIVATLLGSEAAYFSNFLFHNFWTYKDGTRVEKSFGRLLAQFHLSAWSGMLLNTLIVFVAVTFFALDSAIGLVIASVIVLFWNYFWTKFYIWRKQTDHAGTLPKVPAGSKAS